MTKKYIITILCLIPILSISQTHEFRQSSGSMLGTISSSTDDAILTLSRGQIEDRGGIVFDIWDKLAGASTVEFDFWEAGVRDSKDFKISRYKFPRLSGGTYADALTIAYNETTQKSQIGINTDSPSEILDIVNGINSMTMDGLNLKWKNSGTTHAQFSYGFGSFLFTNSNVTLTSPTAPKLQFQNITNTGLKTQLRVDYDGDVGIGHDIGPVTASVYLEHKKALIVDNGFDYLPSGSTSGVKIQNAGSLNKYFTLYVSEDDNNLYFYSDESVHPIARITGSSGSYTSLSDIRLKNNIRPLTGVLEKLKHLSPSSYNFKSQSDYKKRHIGIMAQELVKQFPEVVAHDSANDLYHVEYGALSTIAIKAIQEQQEIITALKEELNLIKEEVQILKRNKK